MSLGNDERNIMVEFEIEKAHRLEEVLPMIPKAKELVSIIDGLLK